MAEFNNASESQEKRIKIAQKTIEKGEKALNAQDWTTAQELFHQASEMFGALDLRSEQAQSFFFLGLACENSRNWTQALQAYQSALQIKENFAKPVEIANIQKKMARVYFAMQNFDEAHQIISKAIDLLDEQPKSNNLADAFYLQALIYLAENSPDSAYFFLMQTLERAQNVLQFHYVVEFYDNLGETCFYLGKLVESRTYFLEALRLSSDQRNYKTMLHILVRLTESWRIQEVFDKALAFIEDAVKILHLHENQISLHQQIEIYELYSRILVSAKEITRAEEITENTIILAEKNNFKPGIMRNLFQMASIHIFQGRTKIDKLNLAQKYLDETDLLARELKNIEYQVRVKITLSHIAQLKNNQELMQQLLIDATTLADQAKNSAIRGEIFLEYGLYYHQKGDFEKAFQNFTKALEIFKDFHDPENTAESHYNIACMASKLLYPEETLSHLQEAVQINPKFKHYAKEDEDFKAIWNDDPFKRIVDSE